MGNLEKRLKLTSLHARCRHFMDIIDGLRDEAARLSRQPDDLLHAGVGITWDKKKDANAVVQAILYSFFQRYAIPSLSCILHAVSFFRGP